MNTTHRPAAGLARWAAGLALLASPYLAHADARVDLYGVAYEELEINVDGLGGGEEDGQGYGIKGLFTIADLPLLLTAEAQTSSLDDIDLDLNQYRGGLGWLQPVDRFKLGGYVEYVKLQLDGDGDKTDLDGFGVHGRVEFNPLPALNLHGQAGYLRLEPDESDDSDDALDGYELQAGAAYAFTDLVSVFADYRFTDLEQDPVELKLNTVRAGVRFTFAAN